MSVAAVAGALAVLGLLDGALAGFRSSLGRTGLVEHRARDRTAARRGLVLMAVLLAPVALLAGAHALGAGAWPADAYLRAGTGMLVVYLPYAALTLLALAVYVVLDWRSGYLASAMVLGPFTLVRPLVAAVGVGVGVARAHDQVVALGCLLALAAVLAVEPLSGRLWWTEPRRAQPDRPVADLTASQ